MIFVDEAYADFSRTDPHRRPGAAGEAKHPDRPDILQGTRPRWPSDRCAGWCFTNGRASPQGHPSLQPQLSRPRRAARRAVRHTSPPRVPAPGERVKAAALRNLREAGDRALAERRQLRPGTFRQTGGTHRRATGTARDLRAGPLRQTPPARTASASPPGSSSTPDNASRRSRRCCATGSDYTEDDRNVRRRQADAGRARALRRPDRHQVSGPHARAGRPPRRLRSHDCCRRETSTSISITRSRMWGLRSATRWPRRWPTGKGSIVQATS